MKKSILATLALGLLLASCGESGTKVEAKDAETVEIKQTETSVEYTAVREGSQIEWRASHLGGVQPRFGKIFASEANVIVNNGELANASVTIDMPTLTVENFEDEESKMKLTGHLLNEDFFLVEQFPTAKFELTSAEASSVEGFNSTLTGNLTIKEATKSITFSANVKISDSEVSISSEDFVVDRSDWGLTYHEEGSEGVPTDYLISNEIGFTINFSVSK